MIAIVWDFWQVALTAAYGVLVIPGTVYVLWLGVTGVREVIRDDDGEN